MGSREGGVGEEKGGRSGKEEAGREVWREQGGSGRDEAGREDRVKESKDKRGKQGGMRE